MEQKLVSACFSRKPFEEVKASGAYKQFSGTGQLIFKVLQEYYDRDPDAQSADRDLVCAAAIRKLPPGKHREALGLAIRDLPEVSAVNVAAEVRASRLDSVSHRLQASLLNPSSPATRDLAQEYLEVSAGKDGPVAEDTAYEVVPLPSPQDLSESISSAHRIPIMPLDLNNRIHGGALPGQHVFVFARPEAGKTAFAINTMRIPAQRGYKVLYLGNEDPVKEAIITRAYSSFSGIDFEANPEAAYRLAMEKGIGNVTFVSWYPGTVQELAGLVEAHKPALVIVDQVSDMAHRGDSYTLQLGKIMRGIRTVTKKFKTVTVTFHQAGDSADEKLVLGMGDVNWSNTDMQATTDLMLGIGVTQEFRDRGQRMITICKNKLSGKHDFFPVQLDETIHRYSSVGG